jgi:hypothetical protein
MLEDISQPKIQNHAAKFFESHFENSISGLISRDDSQARPALAG